MNTSYQLFIDGVWREGSDGTKVPVINPATEEVFAEVSWGTPADANLALEAAEKALSGEWSTWSPTRRGRFLFSVAAAVRKNASELSALFSKEHGKPLHQAASEVEDAARYLEYFGGWADKLTGMTIDLGPGQMDYVLREPLGVTVHIAPWNYPLDIFCRSIAPALAAGNTCVVKPAEEISIVSLALASLFQEEGIPAGVLNVIPGSGAVLGQGSDRRPAGAWYRFYRFSRNGAYRSSGRCPQHYAGGLDGARWESCIAGLRQGCYRIGWPSGRRGGSIGMECRAIVRSTRALVCPARSL